MKRLYIFLLILLPFAMICCELDVTSSTHKKITGLWQLYIIEQQDPVSGNWHEYKNGMQGYILYDEDENMAVHLTSKGYQHTDIIFHDFIDTVSMEELKHRTQSYVYFAKYSIDEDNKVVTHSRISHSNPNMWNVEVKRSYKFKGDTLVLKTLENRDSPLRVKWLPYK